MADRKPVSFKLSSEAIRILAKLARKMGVTKTAIVESAIRRMGGEAAL